MQPGRRTFAETVIPVVLAHVRFKRRDPAITDREHQNYLDRLRDLLMKSGRPLRRQDHTA